MTKVIYTIERTRAELATITVEIDEGQFEGWSRAPIAEASGRTLSEFLESHRDWPDNIEAELAGASWSALDTEIFVRRGFVLHSARVAP